MGNEEAWSFYALVGFMVLSNIGTIGAVIWFGFKASWWLSKLDSRVESNRKDVNNAHSKIRDLERRGANNAL